MSPANTEYLVGLTDIPRRTLQAFHAQNPHLASMMSWAVSDISALSPTPRLLSSGSSAGGFPKN